MFTNKTRCSVNYQYQVNLLVRRNPVWPELVGGLAGGDDTEPVTEVLLLEELPDVVPAGALAVLDGGLDKDALLLVILFDDNLAVEVVLEASNLHLLDEVLGEILKLEELV